MKKRTHAPSFFPAHRVPDIELAIVGKIFLCSILIQPMSYVSWSTGRDALTFCGFCFGSVILGMGLIMYFIIGPIADALFQMVFLAAIIVGAGLIIMGLALYPGTRRRGKIFRKVIEIAAVEKEVTISEIHTRTGIDSETVRQILVHCLVNRSLFGYIEDDLFVRDTSGRPTRYSGQPGLYGG